MNILKLNIILFSFVFTLLLGCLKQNNGLLSTDSTRNYLLLHRQAQAEMDDPNMGSLKAFFADMSSFRMNYNIKPNIREDKISIEKDQLLTEIQDASSELDSNSTFVYAYEAHGCMEGAWQIIGKDPTMKCNSDNDSKFMWYYDILKQITEGRKKNGKIVPFKRLILLGDTCYSEALMKKFDAALKKENIKLFEEAIYIATSDSNWVTAGGRGWSISLPILFFLRVQQISSCKKESTSYAENYDKIKDFLDNMSFKQEAINAILEVIGLEDLIKSPNYNEKNPTFNDLALILGKIRNKSNEILEKMNKDKTYPITPNISFSNESVRNQSIFPSIANCN